MLVAAVDARYPLLLEVVTVDARYPLLSEVVTVAAVSGKFLHSLEMSSLSRWNVFHSFYLQG